MEKVDNYPVKIAIFGAAREPKAWTWFAWPTRERMLTEDLGEILGIAFGDRIEILTGACIGVPDLIANKARRNGARVIGYSSEQTLEKHMINPNYASPKRFDELKFINPNRIVLNGLTERSLEMIKDADDESKVTVIREGRFQFRINEQAERIKGLIKQRKDFLDMYVDVPRQLEQHYGGVAISKK